MQPDQKTHAPKQELPHKSVYNVAFSKMLETNQPLLLLVEHLCVQVYVLIKNNYVAEKCLRVSCLLVFLTWSAVADLCGSAAAAKQGGML